VTRQNGAVWTEADLEALLVMRQLGATAAEIGWALDRSVPAIHTKVSALGLPHQRPDAAHATAAPQTLRVVGE
jgi:hypothetical protein